MCTKLSESGIFIASLFKYEPITKHLWEANNNNKSQRKQIRLRKEAFKTSKFWITNKDLPYTWNSAHVAAWMGGDVWGNEHTYMYVWVTSPFTWNYYNIVCQLAIHQYKIKRILKIKYTMEGEKRHSVSKCNSKNSGQLEEAWDNGSSGKPKQTCQIKPNFELLVNLTTHIWIYPLVSVAIARTSVQTTINLSQGCIQFAGSFPTALFICHLPPSPQSSQHDIAHF